MTGEKSSLQLEVISLLHTGAASLVPPRNTGCISIQLFKQQSVKSAYGDYLKKKLKKSNEIRNKKKPSAKGFKVIITIKSSK